MSPTAAKEKDECRTVVRRGPARRFEDVQTHRVRLAITINKRLRAGQSFGSDLHGGIRCGGRG